MIRDRYSGHVARMKAVINDYINTLRCGPFERSRLMRENDIKIRFLGVKCE